MSTQPRPATSSQKPNLEPAIQLLEKRDYGGRTTFESFVDAQAVAQHLKLECRQVLALTRAHKLPAHPIDPAATRKQWRYKLSEVDAAIAGSGRISTDSGIAQNADRQDNSARQPRHQKAG